MLLFGVGKTSVIAEFVQSAINSGRTGIWLVAAVSLSAPFRYSSHIDEQSNVAVKNIAEKLAKVGFMDWRLLVSRDFHFDWLVLVSYRVNLS